MFTPYEIRSALDGRFTAQLPLPPHIEAFAAWISHDQLCSVQQALEEQQRATGVGRRPDHAACIGYAIAMGKATGEYQSQFNADLDAIAGRTFFAAGKTPGFEVDGVALLGFALGLTRRAQVRVAPDWFVALLKESQKRLAEDVWHASLVQAALDIIAGQHIQSVQPIELRVALMGALGSVQQDDDLRPAWSNAIKGEAHHDGPVRDATNAAVARLVIERMGTVPVESLTPKALAEVLQGVQRAMRLWTWETDSRTGKSTPQKWHIDHEYHVQNLLYVILSPIIPDLKEEGGLQSIGQKTPRPDLSASALRTLIEVKFIRERGRSGFRKVIDEIASDASLYLADGSPYDHLIAFIWDDHAQTEEHALAIQGLKKIAGIFEVIIVPRPGKMTRTA